jgi:apolipoprotein N-acyltransferase
MKQNINYPILSAILLGISRLPLHLGFLVFFGMIPLFFYFDNKPTWKQLLLDSFFFSVVYLTIALHWISLVTFPGFLGMYFLYFAYFFLIFAFLKFTWKNPFRLVGFCCVWISFELLQTMGEFRFPWLNIGYSLADYLYLLQPAELGGIYLLSAGIIVFNWLLYSAFRKKVYRYISFLFILLWLGYGMLRYHTISLRETGHTISIVQVAIPQDLKWDEEFLEPTIELYRKYTKEAAQLSDMVIFPESAIPQYIKKNRYYQEMLESWTEKYQTNIFTGFLDYKKAALEHPMPYLFYNSATLFDTTKTDYPVYQKNILVPFGERMPFLKIFPFLWNVQLGQANFEFGNKQILYPYNNYQFSPLICYEIAYPAFMNQVALETDFFVNITNDAWFKRSAGTYQHAKMAVIRAIETRTQIYRAANTGFSMIISPSGAILQQSELYEKTILTEQLFINSEKSIFTKYLGWFPFVFLIGAGMCLVNAKIKNRGKRR